MSKKDAGAIVSGAGWIGSLAQGIVKGLRSKGISDEEIRKLVSDEVETPIGKIVDVLAETLRKAANVFSVLVDYGRSVVDLVAAGKYDWKNDNVNDNNFPVSRRGTDSVEVHLVHFNRMISTQDALNELDRQGLKPADLHTLLSLGAKYPDLQREFPIVALGSVWRYRFGDRSVPYLYWRDSGRSLYLRWIDYFWREFCRFAAVRK
jgi:hypothetical protein